MTWVYQLRDRKAADAADYQTLLRNADTVLKDDVLASKSLLVMPKGSVTLKMPMDEDAQFVRWWGCLTGRIRRTTAGAWY